MLAGGEVGDNEYNYNFIVYFVFLIWERYRNLSISIVYLHKVAVHVCV